MRGGTWLPKVRLAPAARSSEDIDLVVVGERPEGQVKKGLVRVLADALGQPSHFPGTGSSSRSVIEFNPRAFYAAPTKFRRRQHWHHGP